MWEDGRRLLWEFFLSFFLEIKLEPTDVDVGAYTSNSTSLHLRQVGSTGPSDRHSFHHTPVAEKGGSGLVTQLQSSL